MGAIRIERGRVETWASRRIGHSWRAFDLQLVVYALLLAVMGLAMAYTNSAGDGSPLSPGSTFQRGLIWMVLAVVVFAVSAFFDYRWLKHFAWPIYGLTLGLLVMSLAIGSGVGNSSRWISIFGLQFQFSELAKILMTIVLARYLSDRRDRLDSFRTIAGAVVLFGPPLVLVLLQPDLGTTLCLGAILLGTLFLSGASLKWLGILVAGIAGMIPVAWTYVLRDYQKARLISFLDPNADPQGSGFQLLQSQAAVASGGAFGKGLTNGGGGYLPVSSTDFVFAVLGEELGFVGGLAVFALFILLLWRILTAGWRSHDPFGNLFASGLASVVLFQLLVNVGMVIGIMPITGIPLPFVTHGGASLISMAIGLGLLQSINMRQARAEW